LTLLSQTIDIISEQCKI